MKRVWVIALAFVLALAALAGCARKIVGVDANGNRVEVKDSGDTMTIKGEGGEVTIASDGSLPWPKGSMGDLPELKGNITAVADTDEGAFVSCDEVSKSDYEAYVTKLKGLGYEAAMEAAFDENTFMFMGQKGDYQVVIQLHLDGDGKKGSCTITYGKS